ncbi:MAG: dockerin type I repeat-containing protein, partial [Eubacteriales bacterium]
PNLGFLKNTSVFRTEEEIREMTIPECYAYLGKLLVNEYIEFGDIPDTATSFRSVVTYLLIDLAKDVIPEYDFDAMITAGTLNPFTDGVFIVGAALGRYYLNGLLPIDIQEGLNFEQTISAVFDWFLSKYGGLFDRSDFLPSDTVWNKIDKILFDIIPLNWLPAEFTGSKSIVMDWFFGNILDFDYVGLLSIVKRNPTSELNNSVVKVILNTLSRILKGAVGNHISLPMNLVSFESIFTKSILRSTLQNLSQNLADHGNVLLGTLFPLVTSLMGIWTKETYIRKPPLGSPLVGIEALQKLLDLYTPRNLNANIQYYQSGYNFFGEEDFAELRTYFNFIQAKTEVQSLLDAYAADPESLDLQKNTDAAYRVTYYYNRLVKRSELCATQLTKEVAKSYYADYENGPANTYTAASYAVWLQAYNFAKDVRIKAISNTPGIRQSMVSEARHKLFIAVKGLKAFVPFADYTQLNLYIAQAQDRYNTLPSGIYTSESIQVLANTLSAAKKIDKTISFENQAIVDTAASDLYSAMYGLQYLLAPAIIPIPDSTFDFWGNPTTPVVNTVRKYIYGLSPGGFTIDAIRTVGGGAPMVMKTAQGCGTGTRIRLLFNGLALYTLTVIFFGDVNGDGNIDDGDSGIIIDSENKLYTLSADKKYAGDLNGDGNVDSMDAGIATDVLNCVYYIDQTTGLYMPV